MQTPTQIERNQLEAAQLDNLAARATDLARIRRLNLGPMKPGLLWAEWHFYKAAVPVFADDVSEWFENACDNLGVDAEGEPIANPDAEADYRYDLSRDEAA